MKKRMKIWAMAAAMICAPIQLCLADSIHLEFNEAGTMYYNASYTTHSGSGTLTGGTGTYDGFNTTLTYNTGSIFGGASGTFLPVTNPSTTLAWILVDSNGKSSDLVVLNVHTIFVFDVGSKDPGDASSLYALPNSKNGYDLTDPNGLAGYLENVPGAPQKIAAGNISIVSEHYVTDTHLSGMGYQVSGITSGVGAMQFDGSGPVVPTTITFISDPVPLPSAALGGIALVGLLLARRRVFA